MVFYSLTFLFLFLPASLVTYHAVPLQQVRNVVLIAFSIIFYAWGEPIWVALLLFSAVWDYLNGLFIGRYRANPTLARLGVISSLAINLGFLSTFKYADFVVATVN